MHCPRVPQFCFRFIADGNLRLLSISTGEILAGETFACFTIPIRLGFMLSVMRSTATLPTKDEAILRCPGVCGSAALRGAVVGVFTRKKRFLEYIDY